ncbi:MAG: hypothetical protein R2712_26355 [Vicinamibacterales bacterium]
MAGGRVGGRRRAGNPWRALLVTTGTFSTPGLALVRRHRARLLRLHRHSRPYRVLGELAHAAAHFTAIFYIGWSMLALASLWLGEDGVVRATLVGLGIFGGGWVAGVRDRGPVPAHLRERLRAPQRGVQRAHRGLQALPAAPRRSGRVHSRSWPIKLARVPRAWRPRRADDLTMSRTVPDEPLRPELIEPPIRLGA